MSKPIHYKRARFSTYLPTDRLYSPSHFWIKQESEGLWKVGFTKFATRMLGEVVECDFLSKPKDEIVVGQVVGNLEAFKAMTDLYCVINGVYEGSNHEIDTNPDIISSHPYDKGWLYQASGSPEEQAMDVQDYIELLNETIDKLQSQEKEPSK